MKSYDAVVIGSGPNGLAAAITLAQNGCSVLVVEADSNIGGGARTEALTLNGFRHDVCSAVHPMALVAPFFKNLPLKQFGLEWLEPPAPLAHPLNGDVVTLERSVEATAVQLGADEKKYIQIFKPLVENADEIFNEVLRPMSLWPKHPLILAKFGLNAVLPANKFIKSHFQSDRARALFAGIAAHVNCPLSRLGTASIGLTLAMTAHAVGWPIPKGGAQSITDALKKYFLSLGGELQANTRISNVSELPKSRFVFFDLHPNNVAKILDQRSGRLAATKKGAGVFKMDFALSGPVPWKNQKLNHATTVHLGGSFETISASEAQPQKGKCSENPFVLVVQPSLIDPSRAPSGNATLWAYCHVPNGSSKDMSEVIEYQIETLAPGFRKTIIAKSCMDTLALEQKNLNLVGGDISGGEFTLSRMLSSLMRNPYLISKDKGYYLCSSSTPPGPGVHGMCGYNAALSALNKA